MQAQLTDGLDDSQEQKYTCKNDKTINLINDSQFIVTQKQYMFSGNILARTKISDRNTKYCNNFLLHRNNKCITVKTIN
jgi:hypothetical protein